MGMGGGSGIGYIASTLEIIKEKYYQFYIAPVIKLLEKSQNKLEKSLK